MDPRAWRGLEEANLRWLITLRGSADLQRLATAVHRSGGAFDPTEPRPAGHSEIVAYATGPADLRASLRSHPDVIRMRLDCDASP